MRGPDTVYSGESPVLSEPIPLWRVAKALSLRCGLGSPRLSLQARTADECAPEFLGSPASRELCLLHQSARPAPCGTPQPGLRGPTSLPSLIHRGSREASLLCEMGSAQLGGGPARMEQRGGTQSKPCLTSWASCCPSRSLPGVPWGLPGATGTLFLDNPLSEGGLEWHRKQGPGRLLNIQASLLTQEDRGPWDARVEGSPHSICSTKPASMVVGNTYPRRYVLGDGKTPPKTPASFLRLTGRN